MTTNSNAIPEASIHAHEAATATIPASRVFLWSVKRELWEYCSIYVAPIAVAILFLFGYLVSTVRLPARMRLVMTMDPLKQHEMISQPYDMVALLIMGATFLVGIFYSLDALSGERRDRSILFWKSLPVSDLTTVLAKASIPIVILPVLTFTLTFVTQFIMLLWSSAVLAGSGLSAATLWTGLSPSHLWMGLLFHLVAIHSLWYAPIFAWFLLVSAWARRAAFLWATLPIFATIGLERIAFNTSYSGTMLGHRLGGGSDTPKMPGMSVTDSMMHVHPGQFFSDPGLWIGLAVAAAFLFAAARIRRSRGPA